ncbi:hypothetical protein [Clostridium sp. SM-530-WT-3G]|uniref:hypothetical protein n=1 Tax=Clostridium sp. SM-530-WT-3G TaxID=2725303 RepID=UPI00145D1BB9|nr:hypothetical protein [Clostridium sp. SM-530-WT-3G]NME81854.1 hypothetical protein [Clostridium sp. SM-530-WT-3G]
MNKWKDWLKKWNMTDLKIKTSFLEMDWKPQRADKDAAWELYIELITRITTQDLKDNDGDEQEALESIYKIFGLTREIIKKYKLECMEFTKIAIVILNQVIRPFTAKWSKKVKHDFSQNDKKHFREELKILQRELIVYTQMLGDMAGVEEIDDLTLLEQ